MAIPKKNDILTEVKIPMTPRGVEHLENDLTDIAEGKVKIPMTPRGVEHSLMIRACVDFTAGVKIPMTPRGVEHNERILKFLFQTE